MLLEYADMLVEYAEWGIGVFNQIFQFRGFNTTDTRVLPWFATRNILPMKQQLWLLL